MTQGDWIGVLLTGIILIVGLSFALELWRQGRR